MLRGQISNRRGKYAQCYVVTNIMQKVPEVRLSAHRVYQDRQNCYLFVELILMGKYQDRQRIEWKQSEGHSVYLQACGEWETLGWGAGSNQVGWLASPHFLFLIGVNIWKGILETASEVPFSLAQYQALGIGWPGAYLNTFLWSGPALHRRSQIWSQGTIPGRKFPALSFPSLEKTNVTPSSSS